VGHIGAVADFIGPVFKQGEAGYDAERSGFNLAVEHHPRLIVGAAVPADITLAVKYAADADLAVAVQATGHGVAVPADGAVLINTRRMRCVRVDARARTATVEAGVRWLDVLPQTVPHGLAPLNGSSPDVGVVGYTLRNAFAPEDYARLTDLKAIYDPNNMFRVNFNVQPSDR